jgi:predicted phosphoribosyltransferase
MRFANRRTAGVALGEALVDLAPANPLVLALPRGGVPVGFEVAKALECDLDVLVVRKLGVPFQSELAMGAIAEGGVVIRNEGLLAGVGVDERDFSRVEETERRELNRRLTAYRAVADAVNPSGRTAIVVDDGLATGSTALAAVDVLRARQASQVWVAVPVAPRDTTQALEAVADRVVVIHQPRPFGAVGAWFRDFTQTTDDEVKELLADSRLR